MPGEQILKAEITAITNARDDDPKYNVYVDEELYGDWYDCSSYH